MYHKIDFHADGDIPLKGSKIPANSPADKDETITIPQNRTEGAVRHRLFSIVDRTTVARDGSAGAHALYQDVKIPAAGGSSVDAVELTTGPTEGEGRKFQPLFASLVIDLD